MKQLQAYGLHSIPPLHMYSWKTILHLCVTLNPIVSIFLKVSTISAETTTAKVLGFPDG